jgi:hypothetical protein
MLGDLPQVPQLLVLCQHLRVPVLLPAMIPWLGIQPIQTCQALLLAVPSCLSSLTAGALPLALWLLPLLRAAPDRVCRGSRVAPCTIARAAACQPLLGADATGNARLLSLNDCAASDLCSRMPHCSAAFSLTFQQGRL